MLFVALIFDFTREGSLYPLKKNEHTKEKIITLFPSKPSLAKEKIQRA